MKTIVHNNHPTQPLVTTIEWAVVSPQQTSARHIGSLILDPPVERVDYEIDRVTTMLVPAITRLVKLGGAVPRGTVIRIRL